MDGFSVLSLSALTSGIAHRALSSAEELKDLVATLDVQDASIGQISALAAAAESLGDQLIALEASLNSASVVSERLRTHLSQSLGSSEGLNAVLNKQVMRLQADTLATLDHTFLSAYHDALVAHTALFHYLAKLLLLTERAQQDDGLDAAKGKDLLDSTEAVSQKALQCRDILIHDSPIDGGSSSKGPLPAYDAEPPPYEPPASTSTPSSPQPSDQCQAGSSSSGFAKGFSSLTNSFKAFAAGFKAKPDPLVTAFCQAALRGDVQQMSGFLAQGTNINGRNDEGNTPLSCAILANQEKAVQFLLASGADHASWDWSKMPPLFLAATNGSIEVARLLIQRGANINEKSWSGQPFFADVVAGENLSGIHFLLEHGANPNTVNISGRPVIVQPVRKGNIELVSILLEHGANVNSNDITGNSLLALALALASGQESMDMTKLLLEHGANPNSRTLTGQKIIVTVVQDKKIPESEKVELVRLLLKHGASADVSDNMGTSIICIAMELANTEIIRLLLQHKASTKKKMKSGETLLLYAIDNHRTDQAKILLENGADPNATDKKGRSPLLQAMAAMNVELIRALKKHGADVNAGGIMSPAEFAASLGHPQIFDILGLPRSSSPWHSRPEGQGLAGTNAQAPAPAPDRGHSPPPGYQI